MVENREMVKIKTKDQKGGTNIGQVNIGNEPPKKDVPRWLKVVGALVAIAVGATVLLSFFGIGVGSGG